VAIFNRSHYEDVLVVWVHRFVSEESLTDSAARSIGRLDR
jgi:polyphosphate kinase 2 (PPK2 family)